MIAVWIFGSLAVVLVVLLVMLLALLAMRWFRILRIGGVNVALRWRGGDGAHGWHLGIGRYNGAQFLWFRVLSTRAGPNRVIRRGSVRVAERREPSPSEEEALPANAAVLRCVAVVSESEGSQNTADLEIAMGPEALTGFLSWLESAPPGRKLPWAG